jgi:hypothetical protein
MGELRGVPGIATFRGQGGESDVMGAGLFSIFQLARHCAFAGDYCHHFYVDGLQVCRSLVLGISCRSLDPLWETLAPNPATQNKARFQLNLVGLGANPSDQRGRCCVECNWYTEIMLLTRKIYGASFFAGSRVVADTHLVYLVTQEFLR